MSVVKMSENISDDKFVALVQEVHQLRENLGAITKEIMKPQRRLTTESLFGEDEMFPIKTFAEMDAFEKTLKNDKPFRQNLLKSLASNIGGTTGEENYKKVGNYVMEYCFDVELLKQFSFTGTSKNRNILPKPGFKKYTEIIRLIYKVLHKADASYTIIKNDAWLQDFFKYAKGRYTKRHFDDDDDDDE